ncbi:DNA circularization N-terminal domain-containing protein [Phenylobacterium sp.]|uniref:DNA circularization N-terminal domain-containing protein n=1 Tax=Phenylobacterium sp. TaxID=1871053 RepID=UPI0035B39AB4
MASDWIAALQPASFRGVPFGVLSGESRFGRRLAVHEYPFRDKPWPEDLGRKTRRQRVTGFLVSDSLIYGGGDVIAQRERMVAAAETEGSGALVHPTYGRLEVSVDDLSVVERWDAGRYFELAFSFVESGAREFPSTDSSTGDAVGIAADAAEAAVSDDFAGAIGPLVGRGETVALGLVDRARQAAGAALSAASDATSLFHVASQLQGSFGRYFNGGNLGGFGRSGALGAVGDLSSLVARASGLRGLVADAGDDLTSAAGLVASTSGPQDLAAKAQALASSVRQASADPADALRLLRGLTTFAG